MKKVVCLIFTVFILAGLKTFAQDTIVGWTFPVNADTSLYANKGIASNLGVRFISAEDSSGIARTITWTNGATNYAATATHWENGAQNKFWAIKFNAAGYENLRLYSKQRSGSTNPGPKHFMLQWKFSGGVYEDVPGVDTIVCANDWTGELVDIALPAIMNDTNISIYLRWVMVTNQGITGATVDSNGVAKIDDIIILGTAVPSSVNEITGPEFTLYPNPSNGIFNFTTDTPIEEVSIYNALGQIVLTISEPRPADRIDLSQEEKGMYIVRYRTKDTGEVFSKKMIVQ